MSGKPESAVLEPTPEATGVPAAQASPRAGARRLAALYALVSALLAIPCFWQQHIQAGDLSSHLYNAWLVNEVQAGRLPGLYVVPQFTNVLFDHLLSLLLKTGSVVLTERVAVLLAVLVFFWGCFTLVSTIAGRRAWSVAPFLALLTYGAVFRMGFFNFYLSVGICAWAIALVWQNHPRRRWLAIPVLLAAYAAHLLPCLWAIGVIAYVLVARRLPESRRLWLMAACLVGVAAAALLIARTVPARWAPGLRIDSLLGAGQVLVFGYRYKILAACLLCLWIFCLIRRFESAPSLWREIPFQLFVVGAGSCVLMPDALRLPIYSGSLTFINIRLSFLAYILVCAVIAPVRMNTVEKSVSYALLAVFLLFTYVDVRGIASVERKMESAVTSLPAGARVISTLRDSGLFVPALEHMAGRVCIGRCFDFADYEPATTQFRLRAKPGNPYMVSDPDDASAIEHGEYVWQRPDVELYKLYPCQAGGAICTAQVKPGEALVKHEFPAVPTWWR